MRYIKSYANDAAIQAAVDDKSLGHPYVALDDQLHRIDWNGKDKNYFRITNNTDTEGSIRLIKSGTPADLVLRIRTNGGNWSPSITFQETSTIPLPANGYVDFDGSENIYYGVLDYSGNIYKISADVKFSVSGDIMSLCSSDLYGSAFAYLFQNATNLVDASGLTLPSVTAARCYSNMFQGCTSLTTAPGLPATTLATYSYQSMFSGCSNLKYLKCLATNVSTGSSSPTYNWVRDVPSGGTFVKKAGVNWSTGRDAIPSGWTVIEE